MASTTLKDRYDKLKNTVLGVKTADIDSTLDSASKSILSYKSQTGRNGYVDLVKSLISKTGNFQFDASQNAMMGGTNLSPAMMGQGGRLHRYKTYETIVDFVNYCYRALTVLVDNILSPDDITKISLEVNPESYLEDEVETESKQNIVNEIIKHLKLEDHLELIVRNTLLYGDLFAEIADSKTALTSKSLLAEQFKFGDEQEKFTVTEGKETANFVVDFSSYNEAKKSDVKNRQDKEDKIKNIHIIFHEPKYVVKLQSDLFPVCFGYLVFPKVSVNPHLSMQDNMINSICAKLLRSLEEKVPQMKGFTNDKDLKEIIAAMINETSEGKAVNIRFIPPDKMQHFKRPSSKYAPYGESIFDSTQYAAKVLIALETALAIQRLSRSTEKRKIGVEIGLPRDARNAIEAMKEAFRKRKISLDSFGTIDTIPSMITTFEDVYIPMKDGKQFVDISTFTEGNVDVRSKVDELKLMRDQLVSSLGVPASFLSIEENLSNKAALSEENILFARTVVSHQKYLTRDLNELIKKVLDIVNPEVALTLFDNILIALPSPKNLQIEREARSMSDLANLIETLERIGIPTEYSKKRYLTNIDWDEVEKYKIDDDLDKALGVTEEDDDGLPGGMGGMGGTF